MKQAGEPSVEEILESIKKVIGRDSRAGADDRRVRTLRGDELHVSPVPSAGEDEDEGEDEGEGEEILDLAEAGELAGPAPLIADAAVTSMRESLAALASLSGPGAPPQIVRSGETSLEGMVREMLRPMLAEWLDRNLPPLVERLVAAEIARIVGKKG